MIADFTLTPRDNLGPRVSDCWNQIGVSGDRSCRELPRYIHCHHCPVYAAAAVQLLDRPLSTADRRGWTELYAHEQRVQAPAKTSALLFRLGGEWFALPTAAFQEIAERRVLHRLPHRRSGLVLGLVNVRGELVVCVSLSRLLGLEGAESGVAPPRLDGPPEVAAKCKMQKARSQWAGLDRLLVAERNGQRLAFPVDEVHGVHRFHQTDLRKPPATVARSGLTFTSGVFPWHNFAVGFLDADTVFAALNRNLS